MSNIRRRSSAGIFFAALVATAGVTNAAPSLTLEERMGNALASDLPAVQPVPPSYSFKAPTFDNIEDLEAREYVEKSQWKRQASHRFREGVEKRAMPVNFHPDLEKRWSGFLKKRSGGFFKRQATPCVPSNATAYDMNYMMWAGGANFQLTLCPNTNYNINDTVYFYNFNQQIMTQGYPTGNSRATLNVVGANQAVAVYMIWQGCSIRNVQINGNRPSLGWLSGGAALIETGGPYSGLSVQNCHLYEPRGWSALHIGEGACDNDVCQCSGFQVLNNQVGPAGDSPNTSWQFKRSMEEVKRFADTPVDVLKRQVAQAPGQWADGISLACSNSIVQGNTIVDATDGMIVIFEAPGSTISGNTLIAQSRVALGGIGMVDFNPWGGKYTNTRVTGNTLRAEGAMIKIGIPMGGTIWSTYNNSLWRNDGGIVSNNNFESTNSYFGFGIATAGMNNVVTSGNQFSKAKFNGAPSYACTQDFMPPAPQAAVYDPYSTTGGRYQSDSTPYDLMLLPCIMPCEYSDQGCTWPAWYKANELPTLASSSASSLASSSAVGSSSASSVRASSSNQSSSRAASSTSVSSIRTSSSSSSSSVKVTSSSPTVSSTTSVKNTSSSAKATSSTVAPPPPPSPKPNEKPKATIAEKSAIRVSKPNPKKPKKRSVDVRQRYVLGDLTNENLTERDAMPFLQAGFGRNVYQRDHLTDAAMVL